jgi:hypothetical protein
MIFLVGVNMKIDVFLTKVLFARFKFENFKKFCDQCITNSDLQIRNENRKKYFQIFDKIYDKIKRCFKF